MFNDAQHPYQGTFMENYVNPYTTPYPSRQQTPAPPTDLHISGEKIMLNNSKEELVRYFQSLNVNIEYNTVILVVSVETSWLIHVWFFFHGPNMNTPWSFHRNDYPSTASNPKGLT
jgi:hypothetical protein